MWQERETRELGEPRLLTEGVRKGAPPGIKVEMRTTENDSPGDGLCFVHDGEKVMGGSGGAGMKDRGQMPTDGLIKVFFLWEARVSI